MTVLADLYFKGEAIAKDHAKALLWYRKAADGGEARAMLALASVYAGGLGVQPDRGEARRWLRQAAALGHPEAKALLARLEKDAPPSPAARPLTFKVPRDWQAVEAPPIAAARFLIGGDPAASVAVTALAGGGGLVANVNRWRAQLGLDPLDEAGVKDALRQIKVDGLPGHAIELTGPEKAGRAGQCILAAIVGRGDQVWFFKLMGPSKLAAEQKGAFEEFLRSVRFVGPVEPARVPEKK